VQLVFTANPEDYTARGKIITPLKDRIGSEILTHYPASVALGIEITQQEAWTQRGHRPVRVPDFISELVERIAFEARVDRRIDRRSGVSQRLPITVMENVISNAERRAVYSGDEEVVPRVSDIYAALPAITGKIELEYEGEMVGGAAIAKELIRRAADATFEERAGGANVDDIIMWFDEGGALLVDEDAKSQLVHRGFEVVPGLLRIVHDTGLAAEDDPAQSVAACELALEALVARKRISRSDAGEYGRAQPEPRRRPNDLFGGGGVG
jgi:magnesium chelatase subunit I